MTSTYRHDGNCTPSRAAAVTQSRRSAATTAPTGIDASPRMQAQRRTIESLFGVQAIAPLAGTTAMPSPAQRRELSDTYASARAALASEVAPETLGGTSPVQRLTGAYADAGELIKAYSFDSFDKWSVRLQEAEDLGFAAPKLVGHASRRPGVAGKAEENRQAQNNALLDAWWSAFEKWKKKNKKDEDEDEDGASGAAVSSSSSSSSSGQRSESHRDTYKQQRKTEKRDEYESKTAYVYKPPWHGGPSAWTSNRTGD